MQTFIHTMRYSFDAAKNEANRIRHGLDLADAARVIESGCAVTFRDCRFDYGEDRFVTIGPLADCWSSSLPRRTTSCVSFRCARQRTMRKKSFDPKVDEAPPITPEDIASGKVVPVERGPDGRIQAGKQRVNIFLDRVVIDYFKSKAGPRGYQTLINESLRDVVRGEDLAKLIRRTIRRELRGR
jgi:uncharacterized DUF497 family protein